MLDILQGSATNVDTSSMQAHFPWTVDLTFTSLILVFIGIGFALVSLIDGYLFNDRYPGFGAIAKLRDETKKEIDRLRERLSPEINKKFRDEIKKTNEKRQSVIENILRKEWTPNITSLQNIFDGYNRFINDLNGALTHTVGEYRRVNETYRNTEPPEYFSSDLGKKLSENHLDTKLVFAGYSDLYLSKDQIEKQMAVYLNKLEDIRDGKNDDYITHLNKITNCKPGLLGATATIKIKNSNTELIPEFDIIDFVNKFSFNGNSLYLTEVNKVYILALLSQEYNLNIDIKNFLNDKVNDIDDYQNVNLEIVYQLITNDAEIFTGPDVILEFDEYNALTVKTEI